MVNKMLALIALAPVLLVVWFRDAAGACYGGEEAGRQSLDLEARPQLQRHDVDLAPVVDDGRPYRLRDLRRRDLARNGIGLEPGLRPHPRLADKGGTDHRHADAGSPQLLAQGQAGAADGEFRGGVDGLPANRRVARDG